MLYCAGLARAMRWLVCAGVICGSALGLFGQVQVQGVDYVGLSSVAKKFELTTAWVVPGKTARLKGTGIDILFNLHSRTAVLNENPLALGAPVVLARGQLHVSAQDLAKTLQPLLRPQTQLPAPSLRRIVIDPGHGGKDPGAINKEYNLYEKTLALDISKRLKGLLEAQGYQVFLTRKDDTFLPLTERSAVANRLNGDLFISIHFNTVKDPAVSGVETFAMTPVGQPSTGRSKHHPSDRIPRENNRFDAWNALAGYYICDAMSDRLIATSRGLKRARFDVLTGVKSPAVLVECGFISSPAHARLIRTPEYRQKIAQGIADGVARYQRTLNRMPKK